MNQVVRVLYVHGEALGQAMVRTLENEQIEPVRAEDGVDALKRLDYEPFDVVVTPDSLPDVELPWFVDRARSIQPDVTMIAFGEALDLPPDVVHVPGDEFGRRFLERLEGIIADRRFDSALENQDRLEATGFEIAHAAATAEDIESVLDSLYERLAGSDGYEFVWVGRYDPETGEIEGKRPFDGRFAPGDVPAMLEIGDSNFVAETVESAEVTVASGSATMRSAAVARPAETTEIDGRRKEMSYAAVPLADGDLTRGLALLGSRRTDAFDATERAILGKLGVIVGSSRARIARPEPTARTDPARIKELADVLAHEIRNPLQIAQSYLEVGRKREDDDALERVAEAHATIGGIVDAVVSMAEPGGIDEVREVEVTSAATEVWRTVREGSAELTVGEPVTVSADPDLLVRLLSNVLRNAIDHGGPDVRVRVGAIPNEHGFFLEDDGPGIPEEDRETVFEWGYSTGEENLGLGLGFVREIVEAHGWQISITDARDGGVRFEIRTADTDAVTDGGEAAVVELTAGSENSRERATRFCFGSS